MDQRHLEELQNFLGFLMQNAVRPMDLVEQYIEENGENGQLLIDACKALGEATKQDPVLSEEDLL